MRRANAGTRFRPDVEGLRGVAVLLVVFAHLTGVPRGGFVGVDVFFVISGFLITGLLVNERERSGRISLRHFYARRVRRLMPAGVLALVATDVVASRLLATGSAHATVVDSLWALGFLANVHFAQIGTDYFSLTRPPSAVQHYWSLSVEEQFYLVWPFLVIATLAVAGRFGRRALTVVIALVTAGSLVWSVVTTAQAPAAAYFSTPARAWELGAGALLALLAPRELPWLGPLGAAGLVASVVLISPHTAVPGYALVLPVAATVALLATRGSGWLPRVGLSNPPIRYAGRISYSLYLWHWPVVVLAATLPQGRTAVGKAAELGIALLLAMASYHFVEEPFRQRRTPSRLRVVAPAYGTALVAALAVTWVATVPPPPARPKPLPAAHAAPTLTAEIAASLAASQWPPGIDADLKDAGAPEWIHDKCLDVSDSNARACTYGTGTRDAALVGDSIAVSWLPALRRAESMQGWRLHVLTRRQCPNVLGDVSGSCADHQSWALAQIRRLRPELVVLSNWYDGSVSPQRWQAGTARMLAALAPYTKRIVVLAAPPGSGNLQACYTRLSVPKDCTGTVSAQWHSYAAAERAAVAELGAARADFVDTSPWFCAGDRCPAVVDAQPVMFDGRHVTAGYASRLAPLVATALQVTPLR